MNSDEVRFSHIALLSGFQSARVLDGHCGEDRDCEAGTAVVAGHGTKNTGKIRKALNNKQRRVSEVTGCKYQTQTQRFLVTSMHTVFVMNENPVINDKTSKTSAANQLFQPLTTQSPFTLLSFCRNKERTLHKNRPKLHGHLRNLRLVSNWKTFQTKVKWHDVNTWLLTSRLTDALNQWFSNAVPWPTGVTSS